MNQIKQIFASLSVRQQITIGTVALLVCAGLWGFSKWRREGDFRPLYTGMAAADASAVLQKLRETGVEYRLAEEGRSVLVPSSKLAESRLSLASAGLPKSGRIGFELFDKSAFGATEFVEHINYRRALEGELERSVMSLAEVDEARVHITFAKESVYLDAQQPAKASVMLKLRGASRLAPQNVTAIAHLLASAVEGLSPDAVSIVDMKGTLLSRPKKMGSPAGGEPSEEMIETRQRIERDLVAKINNTLEPLLGEEKFRAGVSVECDFTSGEQSEETYDPSKTVMASSQKTEDTSTSALPFGVPGTASNLPRPTTPDGNSTAGVSRRTENVTFQASRVTRRMRLPQGSITRMSVAVLLDHNVRWEGERRVLVPPDPETLRSIREVVAGVTGILPSRGDQLIIESLPFESTLNVQPPAATPAPAGTSRGGDILEEIARHRIPLIAGIAGCTVLLLLIRRVAALSRRRARQSAVIEASPALTEPAVSGEATPALLEREVSQSPFDVTPAGVAEHGPLPALSAGHPESRSERLQFMSQRIREAVQADAATPAYLLKAWLNESEA